jgi:hypothetical protein
MEEGWVEKSQKCFHVFKNLHKKDGTAIKDKHRF